MSQNALQLSAEDQKKFTVDQLRERLRPFDSLDLINEVQEIVKQEWETLGKNQIDALKLQCDIQFRKLSKVLPDLKAMDHNMGDTASNVNFIINMDGAKPATTEAKKL